jgi:hypothetical protein
MIHLATSLLRISEYVLCFSMVSPRNPRYLPGKMDLHILKGQIGSLGGIFVSMFELFVKDHSKTLEG